MALSDNYKITDDTDLYYAEVLNQLVQALKGNGILTGGEITGTATPLTGAGTHANVSAGDVVINGVIFALSSLTIDLSTEYATLGTDEGMFVYIYADSTGAIQTLAGTKGSNNPSIAFFPPDFGGLPALHCVLGRILLTNLDTTISAGDIHDMRVDFGAQYFKDMQIGSVNAGDFPLNFEDDDEQNYTSSSGNKPFRKFNSRFISTAWAGTVAISHKLNLPTNRGGRKLFLNRLKYRVQAADASDSLDSWKISGVEADGTVTQIDTAIVNIQTPTTRDDEINTENEDVSAYIDIIVEFTFTLSTTVADHIYTSARIECYWA